MMMMVVSLTISVVQCHPAEEVLTAAVSILPCLLVIVDSRNATILLDSVM